MITAGGTARGDRRLGYGHPGREPISRLGGPRPGRSAAPTAASGTETTAGERHVSRMDGDSQPPDEPFSSLRRALVKRLPHEPGPDAPRRGARPPGTGENPSPAGSRGTRSARGAPGKRPVPRVDDSFARRARDHGRARAPPWPCTLLPRPPPLDLVSDPRTTASSSVCGLFIKKLSRPRRDGGALSL